MISRKAFTLIELLIVVAIIAILAAIAVPNFLEAQVRAKVSRAKSDMRTIHTGLEAYKIDTNKYPKCTDNNWCLATSGGSPADATPTLERLSTPIAYLTGKAAFTDPFNPKYFYRGSTLSDKVELKQDDNKGLMWYTARNSRDSAVWLQTETWDVDPFWWFLQASGPDATFDHVWQFVNGMLTDTELNRVNSGKVIYDPTNGTVSRGSLWRVGGQPTGRGISFYTALSKAP